MQVPIEITFRDVEKTSDFEQLIRHRAEKLDKICDYLISCRVVVEKVQRNQRSGIPYRVRIDVTIPPGHEVVVSRDPSKGDLHLDLGAEIRWAFDTAERRVRELMDRQRRDVKIHPEQMIQGIVVKLFPLDDSGFIRTLDGREIYFHRNSVLHSDYGNLKIGTGVRFSEEMGELGPQASSVQVVDTMNSY